MEKTKALEKAYARMDIILSTRARTDEKTLMWLFESGVFPKKRVCIKCGESMEKWADESVRDGYRWVCANCRFKEKEHFKN